MNAFRRLILPVDGSDASDSGIAFTRLLAQREGAAVDVCSVVDQIAVSLPLAEGALVNPAPLLEIIEATTAQNVAAAVARLVDAGVAAVGTVLHGSPVSEIDDFTRHRGADAIVLGTNGRSGVERMFMGSVTTALLRSADVPVITLHADDVLRTGPLLVAVDSSAASLAALECAIDRARMSGASLHLLHVFEEERVERLSVALGLSKHSARRQAFTAAEDALDDAADRVRAAGIPFTTELQRGVAAPEILGTAEREGAAGIAIGTHGRGMLERFILGSVADIVVRNARLPVYVVRRAGRDKERRSLTGDRAGLEAALL